MEKKRALKEDYEKMVKIYDRLFERAWEIAYQIVPIAMEKLGEREGYYEFTSMKYVHKQYYFCNIIKEDGFCTYVRIPFELLWSDDPLGDWKKKDGNVLEEVNGRIRERLKKLYDENKEVEE